MHAVIILIIVKYALRFMPLLMVGIEEYIFRLPTIILIIKILEFFPLKRFGACCLSFTQLFNIILLLCSLISFRLGSSLWWLLNFIFWNYCGFYRNIVVCLFSLRYKVICWFYYCWWFITLRILIFNGHFRLIFYVLLRFQRTSCLLVVIRVRADGLS